MKKKISKQNVGNAGEYYVAALLSAKDFVVTVTLGRNEKYDLLAVRKDNKVFKISVKTLQKKSTHWLLSDKYENISEPNLFYFFVYFTNKGEWDYWVVPSSEVAFYTKYSHNHWENRPGKDNQMHKKGVKARGFDTKQIKDAPKNWDEKVRSYHKNLSLIED